MHLKPAPILIIDDEKDYLETLAERLSLRGYACLTALNGEQGLKLLKEHKPPLVLLDLKMPGLSGLDVLKIIKENFPQIQVIVITGHGSEKEKRLCLELGALKCFNKPVDFKTLIEEIKPLLNYENH